MQMGASENEVGQTAKTVMIVDDSRSIRAWLRTVLGKDPRLAVVAEAESAVEARDILRSRKVDVATLDIEMPGMSGLEFLERLMRSRPMPVVMMSSHTSAGSDAAIKALSLGAFDCMVKPTGAFGPELTDEICDRVYQAAVGNARPVGSRGRVLAHNNQANTLRQARIGLPERRGSLIVIGASTGGVAALETVLPELKVDGPPVVIVQHMPGNFLTSFAARLNKMLRQNVSLAQEGVDLARGDVVLAPAEGMHLEVFHSNGSWRCRFAENTPEYLHCPSVDVLFHSAVPYAPKVAAAILTGLGRDGADGMLALHQAGAQTIGQDEETCVVYGMPRSAFNAGAITQQLPLEKIADALNSHFSKKQKIRAVTS